MKNEENIEADHIKEFLNSELQKEIEKLDLEQEFIKLKITAIGQILNQIESRGKENG